MKINDIKRSTASCVVLSAIFIIFLLVFTFGTILSEDRKFSEMENRTLAQKPEFSTQSVFAKKPEKTYMDKTEDYMADQIYLKDAMMSIKTCCDYFSGRTYQNGVYFSKDGYLLQRYTEDTENLNANIDAVNSFADKNLIPVDMILIPNSICINSSKLPAGAVTDDQLETIKTVRSRLSQNVTFYDPTQVLSELNASGVPAYYRTDHHWTASAARAVCDDWLVYHGHSATDSSYTYKTVPDFYGTLYSKAPAGFIKPDTFGYYEKNSMGYEVYYAAENKYVYSVMDQNYLDKKDKYASFFGGNFAQLQIKSTSNEGKSTEKLLVLKDSYANSMLPFLADRFSEVYAVDLRYFHTAAVSELVAAYDIDRVLLVYNVDFFNEDRNFVWLD